jgi:thiamine pyrophosphate-dependent acetolactate synthase large subunit-like protein
VNPAEARASKSPPIDQQHEDIGRNMPIDLGIVSCEHTALEALADLTPKMTHVPWVAEIAGARKKFEDQNLECYIVVGDKPAQGRQSGGRAPHESGA